MTDLERRARAVRGCYPILDARTLRANGVEALEAAQACAAAGLRLVQYRHKDLWTRRESQEVEALARLLHEANILFIVNDRADIALAVGADGVHLGQEDLTPEAVRSFAGDKLLIGLSTHNEAQLRAAADTPADYVAIGPIYATASKERPDPIVGLDGLSEARRLTGRPLVAIGGITRERGPEVYAAGADCCAVVADLFRGDWRRAIREWAQIGPGL